MHATAQGRIGHRIQVAPVMSFRSDVAPLIDCEKESASACSDMDAVGEATGAKSNGGGVGGD